MNTLQTYADIKIEREGVVAVLSMNRPEKRNALSLAMMRELDAALAQLAQDRAIRVIILRGEGRAFSAGHDLRELLDRDAQTYRTIFDACVGLMARMVAIPQPIIAEVGHVATAAGCQLVAGLRSRGSLDGSDVRDTGRSHRALLQHADGGAYASGRAETRDGDVAHR